MEIVNNYIIGVRALNEALESGKTIEKVLLKQGGESPQLKGIIDRLRKENVKIQFVPQERLNRISKSNHQGVVAYLSLNEYVSLEEMLEKSVEKNVTPFFFILDGISDVRNFGAIARSAECAGATGLIVPAKGGANINADAIKTSAGALLRLPVSRVANIREALFFFKQNDILVYSASEKADLTIFEADFKKPVAIVLGSEDKGVSKSALSYSDEHIRIPMKGAVSSLNVSAAASVICFEVVRQRSDF